jgi:hypothetical protein
MADYGLQLVFHRERSGMANVKPENEYERLGVG